VKLSGGRIIYSYRDSNDQTYIASSDLSGSARNVASLGLGGMSVGGFDADDDQVAYVLRNCQGRPTIWTESLSASVSSLQAEGCPVKFVSKRARVDRKRRNATVRIRCSRGCEGAIELERTKRIFRTEMVGRKHISFPASRKTRKVKIKLRRGTRRALKRRKRFIVGAFAEVQYRTDTRILPEEFRALRLGR
jgi:hypothetical protein